MTLPAPWEAKIASWPSDQKEGESQFWLVVFQRKSAPGLLVQRLGPTGGWVTA